MAQHWPKYHLNKLVQDALRDPAKMGALVQQPEKLFEQYGLSDQEQATMKQPDARSLIALGMHPILAMVYMIPFDPTAQARLTADRKFIEALEKL